MILSVMESVHLLFIRGKVIIRRKKTFLRLNEFELQLKVVSLSTMAASRNYREGI